jgi:hypothetical protein
MKGPDPKHFTSRIFKSVEKLVHETTSVCITGELNFKEAQGTEKNSK